LNCGQIYSAKQVQQQQAEMRKKRAGDDEDMVEENSDGENSDGHVCYMRYCRECKAIHDRDGPCYISPIVPKKPKDYLMVGIIK
jgi:hypothetical protein